MVGVVGCRLFLFGKREYICVTIIGLLVKQVKRITVKRLSLPSIKIYWRIKRMNEIILQNKDGQILASSRDVAENLVRNMQK